MHGTDFHCDTDLTGFAVTEKYDGVRVFWDGSKLITRQGKVLHAPSWFTAALPLTPLDCELWAGYGARTKVNAFMASKNPDWTGMRLMVFDSPTVAGGYSTRHAALCKVLKDCAYADPVSMQTCFGKASIPAMLREVTSRGGEGLVCYRPGYPYTPGRSNNVVKVKPQFL